MTRLWLAFLALLLPCLPAAAAPGAPAAAHLYRITGVALSTRDGSPIPYCRMQVTAANGEALTGADDTRTRRGGGGPAGGNRDFSRRETPSADGVVADAHGHFQIDLPGAGAWRVTGSARGFRRQDYDMHDDFYSDIVLTPATPALDIVFRIAPDAEITGLVTDEAGEPVEHAQVTAELVAPGNPAPARPVGFAQSDDRGRYEIGSLAPGSYRLRIQAQPWFAQGGVRRFDTQRRGQTPATAPPEPSLDLVYGAIWFPGTDDEDAATPIRLAPGEQRQADFHLVSIPAAHLRVPTPQPPAAQDAEGRPRRQQNVTLTRVGDGFNQSTTSSEAELDFGGLSPGIYEIRTPGPDGSSAANVRQIQILPGTSGLIDLSTAKPLTKVTLAASGDLPGQQDFLVFTDLATGRVSMTARDSMMRRRGEGRPEDAERSVYLVPGRYSVSLSAYGTSFLTGITATGATVKGLTVEIGANPAKLEVQIGNGKAEVSGVATLDGQPAAGAMVLLVPATLGEPGSTAEIVRDQTNTDGSYRIRNVIPGRYILLTIANGWGVNWRDVATLAPYLLHGIPLALTPGAKARQDLAAQKP